MTSRVQRPECREISPPCWEWVLSAALCALGAARLFFLRHLSWPQLVRSLHALISRRFGGPWRPPALWGALPCRGLLLPDFLTWVLGAGALASSGVLKPASWLERCPATSPVVRLLPCVHTLCTPVSRVNAVQPEARCLAYLSGFEAEVGRYMWLLCSVMVRSTSPWHLLNSDVRLLVPHVSALRRALFSVGHAAPGGVPVARFWPPRSFWHSLLPNTKSLRSLRALVLFSLYDSNLFLSP